MANGWGWFVNILLEPISCLEGFDFLSDFLDQTWTALAQDGHWNINAMLVPDFRPKVSNVVWVGWRQIANSFRHLFFLESFWGVGSKCLKALLSVGLLLLGFVSLALAGTIKPMVARAIEHPIIRSSRCVLVIGQPAGQSVVMALVAVHSARVFVSPELVGLLFPSPFFPVPVVAVAVPVAFVPLSPARIAGIREGR